MLSPHLLPETLDRKHKHTNIHKNILLVPKHFKTPDISQVCTAKQPWDRYGIMGCLLAILDERLTPLVVLHAHLRSLLLTSIPSI